MAHTSNTLKSAKYRLLLHQCQFWGVECPKIAQAQMLEHSCMRSPWCHPKAALQGLQLLQKLHIFAPNGGKGSMWDGASLLSFIADPEKGKVEKSVRNGQEGAQHLPGSAGKCCSLENSSAGFSEWANIPGNIPV